MSLKQDLRSVGVALRRGSPVVVDVPVEIRFVLMQRYVEMSMRNGRLGLASFAILIFGLAYEAPLVPRLLAWAALAVVFGARVLLARRLLRRLDPADPRSDPLYDMLVVAASSVWGLAPVVLYPWLSPLGNYGVVYAAFVATALLAVTYIGAMPASVVMVAVSVLPLVGFMALQGPGVMLVLAFGTLTCTLALQLRVFSIHGTLLGALAAERQNAALVRELQHYRQALESENATLDSSLRAAALAANRDPLTGLYNRRHITAFAESLAEAVCAGSEEVTLCMVDVDHFKQVNDRHGHLVGDEVLKGVGALLGARLREGDCLARIGGEEFMVVLRQCDARRGRRVAESVRHNVAASQIRTFAGEVPVTVSLGVAQWAPGEPLDVALGRADRALYDAKHAGRDRVEIDGLDSRQLSTLPMDFMSTGPLH
ncbi:MAG TPA: GGDEF domain-containing protein [Burkholderiaceae bacterium]|nr:GGDEF domain-containing protein [Burkholderiaceae bacterium]